MLNFIQKLISASSLILFVIALPNSVFAQTATTVTITIQGSQFNPSEVTLASGDKIVWLNKDSITHTTTSDNSNSIENWDSGNITSGQSYSKVFTTPGTYSYHCAIHPNMKGVIIVAAAGNNTATQLPKTGIPIYLLAILGLVPVGWQLSKIYKLEKVKGMGTGYWEKRQMDKE